MKQNITNILLISANIGSTFDFPDRMFNSWIDSVSLIINQLKPYFIAIHCQEVGGKNYEESMQYVDNFIKLLLKNSSFNSYNKARIYLDEDFTVEEKFTALGNIYFIHESVSGTEQWDFVANKFIPVEGRELFTANIEHVPHKFKEKFPLEFFPEQKWSRKGYIHTRWKIWDMVLDFVNIHLFHDICNLTPIIKDSTAYSSCRYRGLEYTLKKVTKNYSENVPLFIFGDFNFRLNAQKLIKQLIEPKATIENIYKKQQNKPDEIKKIVYRKSESSLKSNNKDVYTDETILEVEKKTFAMLEYDSRLFENYDMFRIFDEEPSKFFNYLIEFPISFPPSYPFSEDEIRPKNYMKTRCPSWCDRIFLNAFAKNLITQQDVKSVIYQMIGQDSCVGDHKPIFLSFNFNPLKTSSVPLPGTNNNNDNTFPPTVLAENNRKLSDDFSLIKKVNSIGPPSHRLFNSVVTNDFTRSKRHSIVDSINGFRASIDREKYNEMWNIFDNGRFDKETELDIKFRLSHRPYVGISSSVGELSVSPNDVRNAQSLFIQAAKQITTAETVISAFRQSTKRKRRISESSSENDQDEDQNRKFSCDETVETYQIVPVMNNNVILNQGNIHKHNQNVKVIVKKNDCCTLL